MQLGSIVGVLVAAAAASAVTIGLRRDESPSPIDLSSHEHGASALATRGVTHLDMGPDSLYKATMQVGGKDLDFHLNSINGDLRYIPTPETQELSSHAVIHDNLSLNMSLGCSWVSGRVAQLNISLGGHAVQDQAVLLVEDMQSCKHKRKRIPWISGTIGLGLDNTSTIAEAVANTNQTWGHSLLSNIFASDPAAPRHVAVRLDRRSSSNNYTETGALDIGTFAPGFEAIKSTVKIPTVSFYDASISHWRHWNVLVDGVTLNGQAQTLASMGAHISDKGAIASLDPSTAHTYLPPKLVHAIYSSMGGIAVDDRFYVVPCMAEAQVALNIGGHSIPIHPLDLTATFTNRLNDTHSYTVCFSSIFPLREPEYDGRLHFSLGGMFLHNAYSVFDYGRHSNGTSGLTDGSPHVKLLPLTNATAASDEFKRVRAARLNIPGRPPQMPPHLVKSTYGA